jgi:hypothetical protein
MASILEIDPFSESADEVDTGDGTKSLSPSSEAVRTITDVLFSPSSETTRTGDDSEMAGRVTYSRTETRLSAPRVLRCSENQVKCAATCEQGHDAIEIYHDHLDRMTHTVA